MELEEWMGWERNPGAPYLKGNHCYQLIPVSELPRRAVEKRGKPAASSPVMPQSSRGPGVHMQTHSFDFPSSYTHRPQIGLIFVRKC